MRASGDRCSPLALAIACSIPPAPWVASEIDRWASAIASADPAYAGADSERLAKKEQANIHSRPAMSRTALPLARFTLLAPCAYRKPRGDVGRAGRTRGGGSGSSCLRSVGAADACRDL